MLNEFEITEQTPFSLNRIVDKCKKLMVEAGVDIDWVFGKSRKERHIKYRYIFIYYLKNEYQLGLSSIAYIMHKNHATIIRNLEQAEKLVNYFKDPISIGFYKFLQGIK